MSRRRALPCSAFQPLFFHFLTFKSQCSKCSRSSSHLLLQGSFKLAMISFFSQRLIFSRSLYYQILTPSFPLCYSRQPRTVLLIHEDTSTHSAEPIFSTSALHKCFHLHISLALTSSSCFSLQGVLVWVFCVCVCLFCEQPFTLRRAAGSFRSECFPGRRTDHGNRSEVCLLERPFVPFSVKKKINCR